MDQLKFVSCKGSKIWHLMEVTAKRTVRCGISRDDWRAAFCIGVLSGFTICKACLASANSVRRPGYIVEE